MHSEHHYTFTTRETILYSHKRQCTINKSSNADENHNFKSNKNVVKFTFLEAYPLSVDWILNFGGEYQLKKSQQYIPSVHSFTQTNRHFLPASLTRLGDTKQGLFNYNRERERRNFPSSAAATALLLSLAAHCYAGNHGKFQALSIFNQ